MRVRALKRGTWPHNQLREVGDEFDYNGPLQKEVDGKKVAYFPSWMVKVEPPKK